MENLMLQCCLMNGYCPYGNSLGEIYIMYLTSILILIIIGETLYKYIKA